MLMKRKGWFQMQKDRQTNQTQEKGINNEDTDKKEKGEKKNPKKREERTQKLSNGD